MKAKMLKAHESHKVTHGDNSTFEKQESEG